MVKFSAEIVSASVYTATNLLTLLMPVPAKQHKLNLSNVKAVILLWRPVVIVTSASSCVPIRTAMRRLPISTASCFARNVLDCLTRHPSARSANTDSMWQRCTVPSAKTSVAFAPI